MTLCSVFRRVLIENIIIWMIAIVMLAIYYTENARFGKCVCDPKLVAMKGQEIYYSGPGADKLMAYQDRGCICDASSHRNYLSGLLWVCILSAISGIFCVFYFGSEHPKLTSNTAKMISQLLTAGFGFYKRCNETKEEKEAREKKEQMEREKKQKEEKESWFDKMWDSYPLALSMTLWGLLLYFVSDNLLKSNKPIVEMIQDKNLIESGMSMGLVCFGIVIVELYVGKGKKEEKEETEDEKWRKRVGNMSFTIMKLFFAAYFCIALLGYCMKHNLTFSQLFSIEHMTLPIYMFMILFGIYAFATSVVQGEKYLLKQWNPDVYGDE